MSGITNGYTTLLEYLRYITPAGQTLNEDAPDDAVLERLIMTASRRVDNLCGRMFYPRVETMYYDIPYDRTIWFGDDLLSVISFKNGDDVAIASTEYVLKPYNAYPKYCLNMRETSNTIFVGDTNASAEQVLAISAFWGFHEQYATRAWKLAGTLGAAWASTTTLTATLTTGNTLERRGGQIIKIDNELFNNISATDTVLTVIARGDNGSTAATHLINAPVYVWTPMDEVKELAIEVAKVMTGSRFGENVETTSTYTGAGVIVTPRSLPVWAQEVIRKYQRIV